MLSDPKVPFVTVPIGGGQTFTFERDKLPLTYRVNFTGNNKGKGLENRQELDRALKSRFGVNLDIKDVPDLTAEDFTDRIAQYLTGVPLAQIYYGGKEEFDKDPSLLPKVLHEYRVAGLTDGERKNVPAEEEINIGKAKEILQASEQLGKMFFGLKEFANTESAIHRDGQLDLSNEYMKYLDGVEIDLRLVTKLLEKASTVQPNVTPSSKVRFSKFKAGMPNDKPTYGQAPETVSAKMEDRGDRLEQFLAQWADKTFQPADAVSRGIPKTDTDKLFPLIQKLMINSGVGEPNLLEAASGKVARVRDLYNHVMLHEPAFQAERWREILKIHGITPAIDDHTLHQAIQRHAEITAGAESSVARNVRTVPVPNIDAATASADPFVRVVAHDAIPAQNQAAFHPEHQDLLSCDLFLSGLTIPHMKASILGSLWNDGLSQYTDPEDEAVKIAENKSQSGLATTTLVMQSKQGATALHVIWDTARDKALIVGDVFDAKISKRLSQIGIEYVDRTSADAEPRIKHAIEQFTQGPREMYRDALKGAFLLRNGNPEEWQKGWKSDMGKLMKDVQNYPPVAPIYVTHIIELEKLPTLSKLGAETPAARGVA